MRVEYGTGVSFEAQQSRVRHSAAINHGLPHCSPVNHAGLSGAGREAQREMKPIRLCHACISLALFVSSVFSSQYLRELGIKLCTSSLTVRVNMLGDLIDI